MLEDINYLMFEKIRSNDIIGIILIVVIVLVYAYILDKWNRTRLRKRNKKQREYKQNYLEKAELQKRIRRSRFKSL